MLQISIHDMYLKNTIYQTNKLLISRIAHDFIKSLQKRHRMDAYIQSNIYELRNDYNVHPNIPNFLQKAFITAEPSGCDDMR